MRAMAVLTAAGAVAAIEPRADFCPDRSSHAPRATHAGPAPFRSPYERRQNLAIAGARQLQGGA
jgi:hypothetical protein